MWELLLLAWTCAASPTELESELDRVRGAAIVQAVGGDELCYAITEIGGEGPALIGRVERRGAELWLVEARGPAWRLTGNLATPRIAGPGYKVWIVGDLDGAERTLAARRIGVLSKPRPE